MEKLSLTEILFVWLLLMSSIRLGSHAGPLLSNSALYKDSGKLIPLYVSVDLALLIL